jgi:hypothetical protein
MFLAAILVVSTTGCFLTNWLNRNVDQLVNEYMNTESILDRARVDLTANSENWQQILQHAIDKIDPAETQVRQDLQNLLQRGVENAGLTFMCNISYLRDMLLRGLDNIIAKMKGQPVTAQTGVVCDASPDAIDMNLDANHRNVVDVYGYNLDDTALRLFLVKTSGQTNVTSDFSLVSPFKRVINLGANGIQLNAQSQALRIELSGGEIRQIPVIQAYPPICKTDDFQIPTQSIKVTPTNRVGNGDKDFDGHGPCIRAAARIYLPGDGTQLRGAVTVDAWECPDDMNKIRKDYTEATGAEDRVLYTPPAGWKIDRIFEPVSAQLEYIDHDTDKDDEKADTGLVMNWRIRGDTDGDDVGRTFVQVDFNKIHLTTREAGNCVTDRQLGRMWNGGTLSDKLKATLKESRPQVLKEAEIMKTNPPLTR